MKKMKFLHLDDSYIALMIFKKSFEKDADVYNAQTIEDAKKLLDDISDIECFIMDYNLWGGDSLAFIGEIREIDKYKYTPIIMLTSTVTNAVSFKAMQAGVNITVPKMMQPDDLRKILCDQINAPYVKIISQEYVDLSCTTWTCNKTFYQYCHSFHKLISAKSFQDAEAKMKKYLIENVNVKKRNVNEIETLSFYSHRIILD